MFLTQYIQNIILQTCNQYKNWDGNSMAVQWLGLCAFTVEVPVSIAGGGTRILQAVQRTPTPPPKNWDSLLSCVF